VDQCRLFFATSTQFHVTAKFLTRLRNSVSTQTMSCAKMKDRRGKARSFPGISVAESRKGRLAWLREQKRA